MRTHRIALIRGDGIGPELVEAAVAVLGAVAGQDYRLDYVEVDAGADTYRRTGTACSAENLELLRTGVDATLKGPVGLPDVRLPDGTEAGLLGGVLRVGLDLFANIRPVTLLPGVTSALAGRAAGDIDYVIVRENTEGLYASRGKGVGNRWAVSDTLMTTREGTLRVCRRAFELARERGKSGKSGTVTCVDKSNVLRSHALFRDVFREVAQDYPDIGTEFLYADAAAQALVLRPHEFDVLVMENFLGDVLSDLGGATVGGISVCPSGNLGERVAYFEPIHGSAPDLAGRGLANPVGQILAAALMLDHLGHHRDGARIRRALDTALASGRVRITAEGAAVGGPAAVADALVSLLDEESR
ncbi:isocitrate/isopropylmalate dehydrogenase family protein [Amycolatopsis thermoflava]|uniref:isocitrate/isopropylmalate dehydrogenase family protein n=1 Tax=Amycolatopsis thermoflava TaxID=84480 RepID=UPI0036482D46